MKEGQIVTMRKLRDENSALKRKDSKLVEARPAKPATARTMLQGLPVHRCKRRPRSRRLPSRRLPRC